MDKLLLSVLLLACALCGTIGEKTSVDSDGLYDFREDKMFDEVIETNRVVAVYYHDSHLAMSEAIEHEFRLASKELQEEGASIVTGVVRVAEPGARGLLRRFGISRVPQFLVFHESIPYQLRGELNLTRHGLVAKLREHADPDWKSAEEDTVIEVAGKELDDFVHSRRAVMLMFYAPWCNHCKQLEPTYMQAASDMRENKPPVPFGRLDGSKYNEASARFNVSGFPTLLLFRNGVHTTYSGRRSAAAMTAWVKSQIAPASEEIKVRRGAASDFGIAARDTVVVGFYPSADSQELVVHQDVADLFRDDVKFAHVIGDGALDIARQEFGALSGNYALVIMRDNRLPLAKGEKRHVLYDGAVFDTDHAKMFVREKFMSAVNFATKETWMTRFAPRRPMVVAFTDIDWQATKYVQYEIDELAKVAAKHPSVLFVLADPEELIELVPQVGLEDHDEDVVACYLDSETKRFPLPGKFSAQKMLTHLEQHANGELKPYLRSQKEPAQNPGPVKILVASAFERMTSDKSKDIVVLFTSEASKDSRKYMAVLKKAQKELSADSVLFFRYDLDRNELPLGAPMYEEAPPILVVWSAGQDRESKPEQYKGLRRVDSILDFIRKNAMSLGTDGSSSDGEGQRDEL